MNRVSRLARSLRGFRGAKEDYQFTASARTSTILKEKTDFAMKFSKLNTVAMIRVGIALLCVDAQWVHVRHALPLVLPVPSSIILGLISIGLDDVLLGRTRVSAVPRVFPASLHCFRRYAVTMIALIAHDAQKGQLLEFVKSHVELFRSRQLVATGNTGKLLQEQLALEVERVAHGPYGGDLIIGGRVAEGLVEAVLFFRDPLTAQPHEPDVSALMRVCDVHCVPLATNPATAIAVVAWLQSQDRLKSAANPNAQL